MSTTSKKLFFLLPLVFIPSSVQAITWDQFWRPFTYDRPYYVRPYVPMCDRRVYREEYISGDYWNPGYVRRWSEIIRVPCYDTY
jgi:hypothetical protein